MTEPTPLETRARELLEESSTRLDGATRSRLTQARHAALAQLQQPGRHWWRTWVPAGAAAAVAVAAVVLWSIRPGMDAPLVTQGNAFEDIELLADADSPDFTEESEDLEFYEWAAGEVGS